MSPTSGFGWAIQRVDTGAIGGGRPVALLGITAGGVALVLIATVAPSLTGPHHTVDHHPVSWFGVALSPLFPTRLLGRQEAR